MTYQLPALAYPYDALEPHIDTRTMEIHYNRHHANYVNSLNRLLEGQAKLADKPLEEIISDISIVPEDIRQGVRNHGGGHLNHSLYWHTMGPGRGGEPDGILRHAIVSSFGDFTRFKDDFVKAAMSRFGSGWAWLCLDYRGHCEIITTPNQDSPIMLGYRPVVGVDLWEHAYYLKYQDRKADYLAAWWNVVNWEKVAEVYSHCVDMVARAGAPAKGQTGT